MTWPLERLHRLREPAPADRSSDGEGAVSVARPAPGSRRPRHGDGRRLVDAPRDDQGRPDDELDDVVTDRRLTLERAETHLMKVASDGPAYLLEDYQVLTTGGSSGTRGVFVWDFDGFLMYALGRGTGARCGYSSAMGAQKAGGRSSPPPPTPLTRRLCSPEPSPAHPSSARLARSPSHCHSSRSSTVSMRSSRRIS